MKKENTVENTTKPMAHDALSGLVFNNMDKERLEAMSKLGIAASKAGEALRNTILAMKKLQKCKPPHKQWQRPYKYHR